ncbi:MAG: outer membrane beta-barrel protein [Alphaproteobacteria bacterium]|nr:outer membrane beta-barrel protein [Alphaproteobacteria bacterium]
MRTSSTFMSVLLGATSLTSLAPAAAQTAAPQVTDEIVVRGARIPDTKRATSEISSVLDDVSFQRTGDSDIAAALSRVTGLSMSQGKYIIVRGLNERYSNVTINGSPLPSPEPLQRVAPLDIIPTSILAGSLVQKTFSPEYTGEFGGGQIDLQTKSIPSEGFFDISLSVGADLVTTARDGLQYDGGGRDWLGFDDGTRNTPAPLAGTFATGNLTANQDVIDASVFNPETLILVDNSVPVDYGASISGGASFELGSDIVIGATGSLGISSEWQTREGVREQGYISSALNPDNGLEQSFRSTTNVVDLNAIATLGVELGDAHKLTLTNFLLRSTLKEGRVTNGINFDGDVNFIRQNTDFFERQVWQTQAKGEHDFDAIGGLSVDWRFAYGEAFRDAPFNQEIAYTTDGIRPLIDFGRNSSTLANTLSFSKIEDENIDAGADLELPFFAFGGEHILKGGFSYLEKDRDTLNRTFRYNFAGFFPDLYGSRPDVLFSEPVLASSILDLSLLGGNEFHDNTSSELRVIAGYAGAELEFGPYVRVNAGVRYEDGRQSTTSFNTLLPVSSLTGSVIDEDYFLPAVTVTWNPVGDLQLRAGFSQTITRPQFRETAAAFFVDEDTDLLLTGNPFLRNTELNNFDVRAEYYFSRGQFVTIGGFYKDLTNPIEDAFALQAGGLPIQTYINAPSAELYGFEFEFEKNFLLDDLGWYVLADKELVIKTNYTWSDSSVSSDGTVTVRQTAAGGGFQPLVLPGANFIVDGRPLQGQSTHLVNFQVGLENPETNMRATVLVNWASERIRNVETFRSSGVITPAVIEEPPLNLDFVWSRDLESFGGGWNIGFEIRNILGDDYEANQTFGDGVAVFDFYERGRTFSANLKKSF